jgi:hypothetical protein
MAQKAMGLLKKGPDVAQAATVGEPTMVDPEPVSPSWVVQHEVLGANGDKGALAGDNEKATIQVLNQPAPAAPPSPEEPKMGASSFGQTPPATPAAVPANDPNELKPTASADPNELKPTDNGTDPSLPPPTQVNEIQQGQSSSQETAKADDQTPASDADMSSSKKKKKGLKKIIPF